jgi:uncharacterized protein YuzE
MEITYDTKADALYIRLRDGEFGRNVEIEEGIVLDLDKEGGLLGLEILNASKRIPSSQLASVKIPLEMAQSQT